MGGHGALVCALKNPGLYKSVSAFAPICNPSNCAWGNKAFTGYLGPDKDLWKQWDATQLVENYQGPPLELFVDQVHSDEDKCLVHNPEVYCNQSFHQGRGRLIP